MSPFEMAASLPLSGQRASNQHAHDVGLLHDQEFLAVQLDLGAGPLAELHPVADLQIDRDQLAGLVAAAGTHRGDLALRRLFLGGVGNDDAALGLFFGVDTLDHDAVMQWTELGFGHDFSLCMLVSSAGGLAKTDCSEAASGALERQKSQHPWQS